MTKILTESLCSLAVHVAYGALGGLAAELEAASTSAEAALASTCATYLRDFFAQYEITVRSVYNASASVGRMVATAGSSLNTAVPAPADAAAAAAAASRNFVSPTGGGRILYVGAGTAGILGVIDASECNPTYGALYNTVRGFVSGGWATLHAKETERILPVPTHMRGDNHAATASVPDMIHLGIDAFTRDFLPTLTPADFVVLVYLQEAGAHAGGAALTEAVAAVSAARAAGASVAHAVVQLAPATPAARADADAVVAQVRGAAPSGALLRLPRVCIGTDLVLTSPVEGAAAAQAFNVATAAPSYLAELALKLTLNAVTTCGHVKKGAIYRNRMINVMMTNAKLFHRACGIVADVTGADAETARRSVIRGIYRVDGDSEQRHQPKESGATEAVVAASPTAADPGAALSLAHYLSLQVSEHVHAASSQLGIVPIAIMLASDEVARRRHHQHGHASTASDKHKAAAGVGRPPLTVAGAIAALADEPVIRRAIAAALSASA